MLHTCPPKSLATSRGIFTYTLKTFEQLQSMSRNQLKLARDILMLSHLEYINLKMFSAYEVSLWNFSVLYDYQQSQEHPAKPL